MTGQMTLDDALEQARQAASRAIKRVQDNADLDWFKRAMDAVLRLAMTQDEFIANDLWGFVEKPHEPRAAGAVMRVAARRGWIAATDRFVTIPSVTRHAAPVRVWRSRMRGRP